MLVLEEKRLFVPRLGLEDHESAVVILYSVYLALIVALTLEINSFYL